MLGEHLKKAREDKRLTQADVANTLNISASTIGMYEQGRRDPDTDTLRKLAQIYDVSADYLLGLIANRDGHQHINDDETLEYLDELHKRPEMKTLFKVSRKATKEDIETTITIIEALKKKGGNSE